MAPEILIQELRPMEASLDYCRVADVWTLKMVIFVLLNPSNAFFI